MNEINVSRGEKCVCVTKLKKCVLKPWWNWLTKIFIPKNEMNIYLYKNIFCFSATHLHTQKAVYYNHVYVNLWCVSFSYWQFTLLLCRPVAPILIILLAQICHVTNWTVMIGCNWSLHLLFLNVWLNSCIIIIILFLMFLNSNENNIANN